MDLVGTLLHKYPNLEADKDYYIRVDDGEPYIFEWNAIEPKPEILGLKDYWEQFKDEIAKLYDRPPSQIDVLEATQSDLIFTLMMNGVI